MPKTFADWLHYEGLKWMMPGEAHQLSYSGVWHRGNIDEWATCGKSWLGKGHVRHTCGKGHRWRNPWHSHGTFNLNALCASCFADEIPHIRGIVESRGVA